jgi:hypothetical protein
MPVATRNQSKNVSAAFIQEVAKPVSNPVFTQQTITKVRPELNNLCPWFSSVVKEGLADVKQSTVERGRLRMLIAANPHDKKNKIYKYGSIYFFRNEDGNRITSKTIKEIYKKFFK